MVSSSTAGRSNCEWSSCEEGCTKTIYTCWQIEVAYERRRTAAADTETKAGGRVGRGRLFPNVKVIGVGARAVHDDFGAKSPHVKNPRNNAGIQQDTEAS